MNIAINGFGRVGRAAFKILLDKKFNDSQDINIVAINDLAPVETLSYLLKYDTAYGNYNRNVEFDDGSITVDGYRVPHFSEKDPSQLPWGDLNVDLVYECTGFFTKAEDANLHLEAGAKKVIVSAPVKDDEFKTVVFGGEIADPDAKLLANASCTTNCVTPVIHVLSKYFGVEKALLTTVHANTSTQNVVDGPNRKNLRMGRASAHNIVPTSTGAAIATSKVVPSVENIFDGVSLRVPIITGSIVDLTALLKKDVTVEEVNNAFKEAQDLVEFKGILKYTEEQLVSSDIIKTTYSAIVDSAMTRVVGGNLVKVMAWYDNEWGYSNRLVEMGLLAIKS